MDEDLQRRKALGFLSVDAALIARDKFKKALPAMKDAFKVAHA